MRADGAFRQRRIEGRDPPDRRPQAVHAAGVGRIADRARNIGAVRDVADAGSNRSPRAARRSARRDARIAWILGVAMNQVGGEPAIGKRRAVGAAENDGAGFAQIVDHRAVALGDRLAQQLQPVGGGKSFLIDIGLYRDRHARERANILAARDCRVDGRGLLEHFVRPVVHHGVDFRVHGIESRQRRCRGLLRGNLFRCDEGRQVLCR